MTVTVELPHPLATSLITLCDANGTSPEQELVIAFAEKTARMEHAVWLEETAPTRKTKS